MGVCVCVCVCVFFSCESTLLSNNMEPTTEMVPFKGAYVYPETLSGSMLDGRA